LCGAGNHRTRPRSSSSPVRGSRNDRKDARRAAGGGRPVNASIAAELAAPLILTTHTAARPIPLAGAKIVRLLGGATICSCHSRVQKGNDILLAGHIAYL